MNTRQQTRIYADRILSHIHGSGVDGDWAFKETKHGIQLFNSWHCMDENGYYDGWMDFTIHLPFYPKPDSSFAMYRTPFKVTFSCSDGKRKKYLWDGDNMGLDEFVGHVIHSMKGNHEEELENSHKMLVDVYGKTSGLGSYLIRGESSCS